MAEMLAARSDRDFVTAAPARPRRPAKREPLRKGGRAARALAWTGRVLLAHPREIVVGLALLGGASAIAWNALAVQTSRHPSPLFGQPAGPPPLPPARPPLPGPAPSAAPAAVPPPLAPVAAPAPAPIARPVNRDAIADLIRTGDGAPVPSASRATPPAPSVPSKPAAARDEIGELIRASGALVPPANVGPTDAPERVAAGQRALTKLGYGPLKADGIMGPGTRQAIERFERDRRLAVTGELGSRTARELAAQSGLPVE
jgi:hypothetical protein